MVGFGQIFNRFTNDKTKSGTGFRAGNFGTSGRSYTRSTRRSASSEGGGNPCKHSRWCAGTILGALAIGLFVTERWAFVSVSIVGELQEQVTLLDSDASVNSADGVVHLTSMRVAVQKPLTDEIFGVEWPNTLTAERKTEYCQWQEIRHTKNKVVGKEPDTCRRVNVADDSCSNGCPARPPCGDSACCQRREGDDIIETETWFTYHKGWRAQRINSMLFDDVMTYQNPQRDPFPSLRSVAATVVIGDFVAAGVDLATKTNKFAHAAEALRPTLLHSGHEQKLSGSALAEGFSDVGSKYIYSRVPKSGWTGSLLKKVGSYFIDGVIDLGDMGTCKAGDIRVSFQSQKIESVLTVVAQKAGSRLIPFNSAVYHGNSMMLAQSGVLPDAQMFELAKGDAESEARWRRGIAGLVAFLAWAAWAWNDSCEGFIVNVMTPLLLSSISVGGFVSLYSVLFFWGLRAGLKIFAVLVVLPAVALYFSLVATEVTSSNKNM